ncbi:MAG: hypothetical protein KAQ67_05515 [Gammaproteobacteria bacterium]|nr:hypothetical protein [Gammaproteobacteria bacterium]
MGSGFLGYAVLIELILILIAWVGFIHWKLSKKKKELVIANESDVSEPFEVYLQFINRELSETMSHIDKLSKDESDNEILTMYQYRLKHLDAEQKAMAEAKGDTVKFWELYHSNIDFVHEVEGEELDEDVSASEEVVENELPEETRSMQEQLDAFTKNSESIVEQSKDVIELIEKLAEKNDSEELQHFLKLLSGERDELLTQLENMKNEYTAMMKDIGSDNEGLSEMESPVSHIARDEDSVDMSSVLSKQNSRISELNDVVGNLSLELEEKKALMKETDWVTRQLKETEQVVIILEDENNFLRGQVKLLLENKKEESDS